VFVTHDVDDDAVGEWCEWYDLEHLPEYVALPGVLSARRYIATPELHALRGPNSAEAFAAGRSTYLTIYDLGSDDIASTWQLMLSETKRWADDGRRFDPERAWARHVELFRFDWAQAAPGTRVSVASVPHAGRAGIQAALGEVPDETMRPIVADWYRDIHAPDMLAVDGVFGAVRFSSVDQVGRHLVLFLLDNEPSDVMRAVQAAVPDWRATGRTPSPGNASRSVFNGPFRSLPPLGRRGIW
jgi:hypothetical protein